LTKCLDTDYLPNAQCEEWKSFLWKILDHNQTLIDFVQRAIGYSLTGSTREQCLFILHGPTKTGKSTFLMTLRALLGPYGQQADMASFMHKERDEVRNDLAALAGSRVVCALEAQEGRRLAEALIKQLTGGVDVIKARFLFQEYFEYTPQFKVFLGTNHKPIIGV
jgi:putative DNA primase/helicase